MARRLSWAVLSQIALAGWAVSLNALHSTVHSAVGDAAAAVRLDELHSTVSREEDDLGVSLAGCFGVECVKRYVAFNDGAYSWHAAGVSHSGSALGHGYTSYRLDLSSQRWMPKETGLSSWKHNLEVVVPKGLTANSTAAGWAVLLINEAPQLAAEFAVRTGLVAVSLSDTPPMFMRFGSLLPLHEEEVKAQSWAKYSRSPDRAYPLELPTVKAVVRAMDAVAEFSQASGELPPVTSFAVSGWSKRAIATFMVGAVDPRVKLIVPISHPVNLDVQGRDSFQNLGETVTAAKVYDQSKVYSIDGRTFERLQALIDPVSYLDRLTMPKLVMMCGRDDFFAPDSTRSWWGQLPSPKTFYMFANHGHAGFLPPFKDMATSFIAATVHNKALPMISWKIDNSTGDIAVRQVSAHKPLRVSVWTAHTPTSRTRDFRSATYVEGALKAKPGADGRTWVVHANPPQDGWTAIFAELAYEPVVPNAPEYRVSTEVSVVPATRPFAADPKRANYVFR